MMKVNVPTLKVEDLLDEAHKSNNLHWLLSCIYQRWTKYYRLAEEIEPLRHRYSLLHAFHDQGHQYSRHADFHAAPQNLLLSMEKRRIARFCYIYV